MHNIGCNIIPGGKFEHFISALEELQEDQRRMHKNHPDDGFVMPAEQGGSFGETQATYPKVSVTIFWSGDDVYGPKAKLLHFRTQTRNTSPACPNP